MKIKRSNSSNTAEADMTPMIDMVFQLIIFFMLVMNFDQQQADERVKLPKDPLAEPRQDLRKNQLTVNIGFHRDASGTILSEPLVMNPETGDIPVMQYGQVNLKQEAAIARAQGGDNQVQDTFINIRADSKVPTGMVQELIKFGQEAGFSKFALKAMSGEDE
ncbi:MAG: ExbD/TolR family protein [Planctomycetaceae bacterium]